VRAHSKLNLFCSFGVTIAAILILFFFAINTGGLKTTVPELFQGLFLRYDQTVAIILELRFPRIIVTLLGGALMSVSGVLMQAVMKNPLADPGIIGISSGAALAALIVPSFAPTLVAFTPLFSFLGGIIAFAVVYILAYNGEINPVRLILVGVAVNAVFTGLYDAFGAMGGGTNTAYGIINANISLKTWDDVRLLGIYTLIGGIMCFFILEKCNYLMLSDQTAQSLGINVGRTRTAVSVISVMLASIFASVIGSVSFLGLIVPHIARLVVGSDHKKLIPYSVLLGSFVFLFADTVGRTIAYPYEISSSIIMSVIGGPIFIILLKRSRGLYGG